MKNVDLRGWGKYIAVHCNGSVGRKRSSVQSSQLHDHHPNNQEMARESCLLLQNWSQKLNRGKVNFQKLSRQGKPLTWMWWMKGYHCLEREGGGKIFRSSRKGSMTCYPWSWGDGAEESPNQHLSVKCWLEKVASSCVLDNAHQRYPAKTLLSSEWKQCRGTVNGSYLLTVLS